MSALRLIRLTVAALLAIGVSFLFAPTAFAQYDGGANVTLSSTAVNPGDDVTASATGFLPGEVLVAVLAPSSDGFATRTPAVTYGGGYQQSSVAKDGFANRKPLAAAPIRVIRAIADANGAAKFTFSTAGLAAGSYTVTVTGQTSGRTASATFTILGAQGSGLPGGNNAGGAQAGGGAQAAAGAQASSNSGSQSGSGSRGALAYTGTDTVVPLVIGGGVLVAAGAGALVLSRRRKATS